MFTIVLINDKIVWKPAFVHLISTWQYFIGSLIKYNIHQTTSRSREKLLYRKCLRDRLNAKISLASVIINTLIEMSLLRPLSRYLQHIDTCDNPKNAD